jgi:hypothetical protein
VVDVIPRFTDDGPVGPTVEEVSQAVDRVFRGDYDVELAPMDFDSYFVTPDEYDSKIAALTNRWKREAVDEYRKVRPQAGDEEVERWLESGEHPQPSGGEMRSRVTRALESARRRYRSRVDYWNRATTEVESARVRWDRELSSWNESAEKRLERDRKRQAKAAGGGK